MRESTARLLASLSARFMSRRKRVRHCTGAGVRGRAGMCCAVLCCVVCFGCKLEHTTHCMLPTHRADIHLRTQAVQRACVTATVNAV